MKKHHCYLHIPKTAGMSLLGLLRQTLGEENVFHATQSRHLGSSPEPLLRRYAAVVGHFTFAQIPPGMSESLFLFTFLRDPVDRVLSLYGFYRQLPPDAPDPEVGRAQRLDLKTLLREQDPDRLSAWTNWQTFLLSGLEDCETPAGPAVLELAKRNLRRFDCVGFYEQLEPSIRELWARCGWSLPAGVIPSHNVTRSRPRAAELDDETLRLLRRGNALDQAVYDYAWTYSRTVTARRTPSAEVASTPAAPPPAHARAERGTREIRVVGVAVRDAEGPSAEANTVRFGSTAWVEVTGESDVDCPDLTVGLMITDEAGAEIYGTNTFLREQVLHGHAGRRFQVAFGFEMILAPGAYFLTVAIHTGNVHLQKCFHWIDNCCRLVCQSSQPLRFAGGVDLKASARVIDLG